MKVEPLSGLEFVSLPGGSFSYGCEADDRECSEKEPSGVPTTVPALWMGKTEVTAAAYARCVEAGVCSANVTAADWPNAKESDRKAYSNCGYGVPGRAQYPINCVDWNQANTFCEWIGGRLPTAQEWEYAAKGGERRIYPWGNDALTPVRANFCFQNCTEKAELAPVGSFPEGATKHGLLDMAGNIYEWTASEFATGAKEVRGGGWFKGKQWLRASARDGLRAETRVDLYGFRCRL